MVVRQAGPRVATRRASTAALLATALLVATSVEAAGPIGVVTELQVSNGPVEVKSGGGDWERVKPLLAVNEGDQIRVSGASRAVIVFATTQRSVVVTTANSPYTATAPAPPGLAERIRSAVGFLQTMPRESSRRALTVRSARDLAAVVLLSPRATLVGPDAVDFEWAGPEATRYSVRVVSGDGRVLWEKVDVAGSAIALAPGEARLRPGRYRWEVESKSHGIQRAAFDVATREAAAQARAGAEAVEQAGYPAATAALLKAAGFMRERFHADARRALLRGIDASPAEPTLHQLLAELYAITGPDSLAAAEQATAEALAAGR
jgi:hypothetical protein